MEKADKNDRETADRIYTVGLDGMEFTGFHGCREEEKLHGNIFCVDFCGTYRSICGSTDNLEDAISYGQVYETVAEVMHGQRCNLLETLARRMIEALKDRFPGFTGIKVVIGKKNPPVSGPCSWSRVSTEWKSIDEE